MANEEMRDRWATGADGWIRNERIFDAAYVRFTEAILDAADFASAERVPDIGCGTGTPNGNPILRRPGGSIYSRELAILMNS